MHDDHRFIPTLGEVDEDIFVYVWDNKGVLSKEFQQDQGLECARILRRARGGRGGRKCRTRFILIPRLFRD